MKSLGVIFLRMEFRFTVIQLLVTDRNMSHDMYRIL